MNNKVVLVPFPFDDLTQTKVRPAVCLTDVIRPHDHVVLAFVTSAVPTNPSTTDLIIASSDADFLQTGLKVSSAIKLHRLVTVSTSLVKRHLGSLSAAQRAKVDQRLRILFNL